MNTKIIKVADATNLQLDWLVDKCEGLGDENEPFPRHAYTVSPDAMWPIIERERIATTPFTVSVGPDAGNKEWFANTERNSCYSDGPTSLIAAARCYVVSKLGETVEVPADLV